MLEVVGVSKSFGRSWALKGVSFTVPDGSKTLLLGPNGAGKSTLIRAIMGICRFEGTITIDGVDVSREGTKAREKVGYVPQFSALYDRLTVEQEAKLIAVIKGVSNETVRDKLERLGLGRSTKKTVGSLAGGMRQRFALAMALLTNPPYLVFDEPLSSVDLRGQVAFLEFVGSLSASRTTLLVATHLTGMSDLADQTIVLNKGKVVAVGAPRELLATIDADVTFYIKPKPGMEADLSLRLESAKARVLYERADGIVAAVPSSKKLQLLRALFSDADLVEDVSIETSQIESSYNKLIKREQGSTKA